ncbi:hypothetical protein ABE10_03100, partial [Bacillus toyonensis]|nr:hypothetical protein [Bacillus toyonensis]
HDDHRPGRARHAPGHGHQDDERDVERCAHHVDVDAETHPVRRHQQRSQRVAQCTEHPRDGEDREDRPELAPFGAEHDRHHVRRDDRDADEEGDAHQSEEGHHLQVVAANPREVVLDDGEVREEDAGDDRVHTSGDAHPHVEGEIVSAERSGAHKASRRQGAEGVAGVVEDPVDGLPHPEGEETSRVPEAEPKSDRSDAPACDDERDRPPQRRDHETDRRAVGPCPQKSEDDGHDEGRDAEDRVGDAQGAEDEPLLQHGPARLPQCGDEEGHRADDDEVLRVGRSEPTGEDGAQHDGEGQKEDADGHVGPVHRRELVGGHPPPLDQSARQPHAHEDVHQGVDHRHDGDEAHVMLVEDAGEHQDDEELGESQDDDRESRPLRRRRGSLKMVDGRFPCFAPAAVSRSPHRAPSASADTINRFR